MNSCGIVCVYLNCFGVAIFRVALEFCNIEYSQDTHSNVLILPHPHTVNPNASVIFLRIVMYISHKKKKS